MIKHQHLYDEQGRQLCCTQEEKIYLLADKGDEHQGHEHGHNHEHGAQQSLLRMFLPAILSFSLLSLSLLLDHLIQPGWYQGSVRLLMYVLAYIPVGIPVLVDAFMSIRKGDVFSEFFLMGIATIGAFGIGEYPEAVVVMLFYATGEAIQTLAVSRAKSGIKALIDQRPDTVTIAEAEQARVIPARQAIPGNIVLLKPGEKLALDGELLSDNASFNTAALTGESMPDVKQKGDTVLAGMINLNTPAKVLVTKVYADSKLSRILQLTEEATSRKAPTELFIRKFARIYTPVVVFLALAICLLPWFFVSGYQFSEWLYRALIFLVISCPCALVISIPLGYFGGIGAASRRGILFKGSNYLDAIADLHTVVMDKTGTLTEGVFSVQKVVCMPEFSETELLCMVNAIEQHSTHPIAIAVREYIRQGSPLLTVDQIEEIPGHGLKANLNGKVLLAGNLKLMSRFEIKYNLADFEQQNLTMIVVAFDGKLVGYITLSDVIKKDAAEAIEGLKRRQITPVMLSGDKQVVVSKVASELGIAIALGDLLPEDKINRLRELMAKGRGVAFVGDGINDAPAIAMADIGIAMGGLGSDASVESADMVIQDDMPSKIPLAVEIGKATKSIVWQNISLAFAVKLLVLALGAGGIATMWEAVFADVGVAILAILNAVRIQQMKFS